MLITILLAAFIISLISLIGIFSLYFFKRKLKAIIPNLVAFAAGALLAAAFLDLLPEALEGAREIVFLLILGGLVLFFLIERFLWWFHQHHHEIVHKYLHLHKKYHRHHIKIKPVGYLTLIGDFFHNFIDGVIIAITFLTDFSLGIIATLAIAFHEIPQEWGDFSILVYSGFRPIKALVFNFLTALTAVFGALIGYTLARAIEGLTNIFLAISIGGFIYIAAVDLLPVLHHEVKTRRIIIQFAFFLFGIAIIWLLGALFHI